MGLPLAHSIAGFVNPDRPTTYAPCALWWSITPTASRTTAAPTLPEYRLHWTTTRRPFPVSSKSNPPSGFPDRPTISTRQPRASNAAAAYRSKLFGCIVRSASRPLNPLAHRARLIRPKVRSRARRPNTRTKTAAKIAAASLGEIAENSIRGAARPLV